jgi:hypothetical protein
MCTDPGQSDAGNVPASFWLKNKKLIDEVPDELGHPWEIDVVYENRSEDKSHKQDGKWAIPKFFPGSLWSVRFQSTRS